MKKIDVFDFDNTIYSGDSTVDFYLFCLKSKLSILKYIPKQFWAFILYKLKIREKQYFKETFFVFLNSFDNISDVVKKFWDKHKQKIKKNVLGLAKNYVVVISASPEFLLKDICKEIDCKLLIATDVNEKTGKFNSKNCYGEEKVNRLNEEISEYEIINFYSDSKSDIFLAKLAKESFLVKGKKVKKWL